MRLIGIGEDEGIGTGRFSVARLWFRHAVHSYLHPLCAVITNVSNVEARTVWAGTDADVLPVANGRARHPDASFDFARRAERNHDSVSRIVHRPQQAGSAAAQGQTAGFRKLSKHLQRPRSLRGNVARQL